MAVLNDYLKNPSYNFDFILYDINGSFPGTPKLGNAATLSSAIPIEDIPFGIPTMLDATTSQPKIMAGNGITTTDFFGIAVRHIPTMYPYNRATIPGSFLQMGFIAVYVADYKEFTLKRGGLVYVVPADVMDGLVVKYPQGSIVADPAVTGAVALPCVFDTVVSSNGTAMIAVRI